MEMTVTERTAARKANMHDSQDESMVRIEQGISCSDREPLVHKIDLNMHSNRPSSIMHESGRMIEQIEKNGVGQRILSANGDRMKPTEDNMKVTIPASVNAESTIMAGD
mmetsp:Transcript_16955/g.22825  ORF Transcript_16955/g.22825 Transcript_16955/m.22825 type:complete len:109 (-) Transcript_16955:236-562(-)|eukprot:CAMPEP_0185572508 /NCGR_PEP_ID=MMETSP0434-20130131/4426_1 /TAXON_ID=626734 ORGANISM="Favella taraikaensis, Strain Fe Narragansett Bay" /NCGR_SAMPLE_ID=MMETSP0434 /ASSEMBLY_ACC=CAM_ASM_000379 /LENGTH=108 /DNA_ID=CAMNT_0028188403 /DNA_START=578 /DNA_END=904 /DNA_ORIENTATION=-